MEYNRKAGFTRSQQQDYASRFYLQSVTLMLYGRMIRVKNRRGDPNAVVYVVAESDLTKAVDILKAAGVDMGDDFEDLGRVTEALLGTLALQEGQFVRT